MPVLWMVDKATDELLYQIVAELISEMPDDKYLVADPADRVSLIPPQEELSEIPPQEES
jgi:hypothetical protein